MRKDGNKGDKGEQKMRGNTKKRGVEGIWSQPDTTYKGLLHVFLKSNYEIERNALQVGCGAIFPAHNLFCCLSLAHAHTRTHPHTQNPTFPNPDKTPLSQQSSPNCLLRSAVLRFVITAPDLDFCFP